VTKSSTQIPIKIKHTYQFERKYIWTFAEIGAGQETVRHFFRSGGSSGTIAKACQPMTSDSIYGIERWTVCKKTDSKNDYHGRPAN
jgi:hypothetical protein